MDDDEDQEVQTLPAVRLDWTDAPIIALGLVSDILDAFSQAAANAQAVLRMHYQWRAQRQTFRASVDRDIDELTKGRTDDAG